LDINFRDLLRVSEKRSRCRYVGWNYRYSTI